MFQDIITLTIVGFAIAYTIVQSIKLFSRKKMKNSHACSGCTASCELKSFIQK